MAQNIRRSLTESYDPKQRIVGGIVLFLLMLFLYLVLKIILGISSSLHDGDYIIREQIFEEATSTNIPQEAIDEQTTETPSVINGSSSLPPRKPSRPLPSGFVFLDIKGNPMQKEIFQTTEDNPKKVDTAPIEGTHWVVQAGSFLAEDRAQVLVNQLKNKGVDSEIVKISKWFTVRLLPQRDRRDAEQQLRQLRQVNKIKGLIKKID